MSSGLAFIPTRLNDLTVDVSLSSVARGDILYRGASKWNNLAAGTSGKFLRANGAGADPSWETVATGIGGTFGATANTIGIRGADATTLAAGGGTLTSGGVLTLTEAGGDSVTLQHNSTDAILSVNTGDVKCQATFFNVMSANGNNKAIRLGAFGGNNGTADLSDDNFSTIGVRVQAGSGNGITLANGLFLKFSSTTIGGTVDAGLLRSAASIIEANNGTSGQWAGFKAGFYGSATNSVTNGLTIGTRSSGTPAAGLGAGVLLTVDSTTTANQSAGLIEALWATATHASRKARLVLSAYDTAVREGLRIEASGSAPMIGFLGASAVARQAFIADPSGGGTQDAEARATIVSILDALILYGLLASS